MVTRSSLNLHISNLFNSTRTSLMFYILLFANQFLGVLPSFLNLKNTEVCFTKKCDFSTTRFNHYSHEMIVGDNFGECSYVLSAYEICLGNIEKDVYFFSQDMTQQFVDGCCGENLIDLSYFKIYFIYAQLYNFEYIKKCLEKQKIEF